MTKDADEAPGVDQAPRRIAAGGKPLVNQAGYNLGEVKRFVCPGTPDGTTFKVLLARESASRDEALYTGMMEGQVGDFSDFDPVSDGDEYVIEVEGMDRSEPFWIADHLMEKLSSRLAYQFFIDVRGGVVFDLSPANVTGGGPSRDGGGQTLEAVYEGLLYASNPALFDRWTDELYMSDDPSHEGRLYAKVPAPPGRQGEGPYPDGVPDLIKLILWHAEFCHNNVDYDGPTGGFEGLGGYEEWVRRFGYVGQEKLQNFDYQNMLDQLAAVCAFYHEFLRHFLEEATYQKYRHACLSRWEEYERHKEVRRWVYSMKWIDEGWLEFNEQGNAFGQGLLRNLFMYLCERNEKDGQPERFLRYVRSCAIDIVENWDFGNPVHTWRARNAEHITPQALALLLMLAPEEAPEGTRGKLEAWRDYIVERTDNLWHYRTHSDGVWAHPKSKEVGTVAGLGGAMFAVDHVLNDTQLREVAWSQVSFVFGCNPAGAHLGTKSPLRVALGGYWEGVEVGWPYEFPEGTGRLGVVRGTLDGSPLDESFPYSGAATSEMAGESYGTEGWAITNRAWMSTVAFSTLASHWIRLLDSRTGAEVRSARSGDLVKVELRAALNQDSRNPEMGWVELSVDGEKAGRIAVTETGPNTGVFVGEFRAAAEGDEMTVSYGYLGSKKAADLVVTA